MKPTRPTHRIYVDEVGNPSIAHMEPFDNRFFSLTAVVVELKHDPQIKQEMDTLKQKYFGTEAIILHRNDIENARAIFGKLASPQLRDEFNKELLSLLESWPYIIITACADKVSLQQSGRLASNLYHQCFRAILEVYVSLLHETGNYGDIMLEGRGKSEDIALEREFNRLWSRQLNGIKTQQMLTSKHLKIRPKAANEAGLQLADLLAYPSYREILHAQGLLSAEGGIPDLTKQLIGFVSSRYYKSGAKIKGSVFLGKEKESR